METSSLHRGRRLVLLGTSLLLARRAAAQPADAPPAAPAAPSPPQPPAAPPAAQEQLAPRLALRVIGRDVKGPGGVVVAQVVNVLVDDAGQPLAAVLDYGGFMGVGRRRIAVAWRTLQFSAEGIVLALNRDQLRNFPEYKDGEAVVVAAPPDAPAAPPE